MNTPPPQDRQVEEIKDLQGDATVESGELAQTQQDRLIAIVEVLSLSVPEVRKPRVPDL